MNYITQLENELKEVRAELCGLKCGLSDLSVYLMSSKFHEDPTVQVSDVLRRIADAKSLSDRLLTEQTDLNNNKETQP